MYIYRVIFRYVRTVVSILAHGQWFCVCFDVTNLAQLLCIHLYVLLNTVQHILGAWDQDIALQQALWKNSRIYFHLHHLVTQDQLIFYQLDKAKCTWIVM